MNERDAIFRDRLVALMTVLNAGSANDPALRQRLGKYAMRLARNAGAASWADLKTRADATTYDSLLQLFQRESQQFMAQKDTKSVRAMEALGLSLIARHQQQPDLVEGVRILDNYIEQCAIAAGRAEPPRP